MATIECQAEWDIAAASTLHQQLLSALQTGEPLEIDGQAVRKIHAAVLQLFLSLTNEAQSLGLPVRWRNPSPALVESARLLGLADPLGLGEADSV
ncbi:MAG: STAS domain-containing protein [Gammaproteobacteria bacterium]|nr:STAS domain-containing protein [Gammaproteobacteria bacterium]MCP5196336.1 STAS domain-containing protein [Gammaproteobacteria bacterium]